MYSLCVLILSTMMGDPIQLPGNDTYRGMLIGINDFASVRDLTTPVKDVFAIRSVLRSRYAFDRIDTLINDQATEQGILDTLEELATSSHEQENLLLYFAGHGYVGQDGEGYWVPQDGKPNMVSTMISYGHLTNFLRRIPAKHVLVIVDACYGGKVFDNQPIALSTNNITSIYDVPSRWIITSGNQTPVLDTGPSQKNSVFAHYFINYLNQTDDPYLTPLKIVTEVSREIAANSHSKQYPTCAGLNLTGTAFGSFVLWNANAKNPKDGHTFPPPWLAENGLTISLELQKLQERQITIFNSKKSDQTLCNQLESVFNMTAYCLPDQPSRHSRVIHSWCRDIDLATLEALRTFVGLDHYKILNHETTPNKSIDTCGQDMEITIYH